MRAWRQILIAAGLLGTAAVGLDAAFPPVLDRYADRGAEVTDKDGALLRGFTASDGAWRFRIGVGDVDPLFPRMLTAFEDGRFRLHPGVDPLAVIRAAGQWAAAGRPVSGASTLTMQTARLLEPRPRTLAAKLVEMLRALQLEWRYSKDEILGIYLSVAPYGGNLEGIAAATRFYFGKNPKWLTPGEAALLTVLPQSPERLRPDRHPEQARAARDKVLDRMVGAGVLSAEAARAAMNEPIPTARRATPLHAPHLARALHDGATLIDGALQTDLEALAKRRLDSLEPGADLALLVIENRTRAVRAYVGSGDFLANQVDMVRAVRSPGSTLKPFIYAAAMDAYGIHPETRIDDRPTRFGDYQPTNFDNRYRGRITLREALQLSLNVPAVAVLDRLGPVRLADLLTEAGAQLRFDSRIQRAALPMALGGVGTRLWDLGTLYCGLANGGRFASLRIAPNDPMEPGRQVISERAAGHIAAILAGVPRPAGRTALSNHAVAYKTGTSYGFRDAWAVGFDGDHTVAVWIGRPDGGFGSERTGSREAAPMLFNVFDRLPKPLHALPTPPAEERILRTADLPPPLRLFRTGGGSALPPPAADPFAIAFPPDGATVEVAADDTLSLRADGGRRPLRWLIDGAPLAAAPYRRTAAWRPDGEGAVRLTAIDGTGASSTVRVWIRRAP